MRLPQTLGLCFTLCALLYVQAVKFEEYILAPASRQLKPRSVFRVNGTVTGAERLLDGSRSRPSAIISGVNSSVVFDFGKNVAGRIQLALNASQAGQRIGLTYSESSQWVSSELSDATGNDGDLPLTFDVNGHETFTVPSLFLRGAFKYLTLTLQTTGSVQITDLQLNYTAMPHWEDMRAYTGYFHSEDELLNRIWYAGAYTNQICTISPSEGNALTQGGTVAPGTPSSPQGVTWLNTTITNGTSTVVDGAKRDRLVWPGDYSIAFPAIAVSTYDLISVQNGLDSLFARQTPSGQLPYAGFPFGSPSLFSFTYHLYSLIGVGNVYLWGEDIQYLRGKWDGWKRGLANSLGSIDETGLMNVTSSRDWLRSGLGHHAIEPNAILYSTLELGLFLAKALNDTSVIKDYTNNRTVIKAAANALLWDAGAGLYRDNEISTLHPQDGIVQNNSQALSISRMLQTRWTPFGATAVEAQNASSPFISSFEIDAHMAVNNTGAALELMRIQWGFMMNDPRMTNSTFIEGYSADGVLHYPPYRNDPRISHAHGWATGPTFTLTTYVAGIRITGAVGKTWTIWPQPGNLTHVEGGLSTTAGKFSVAYDVTDTTFSLQFTTPPGTSGSVVLPTFKDQRKALVNYKITRVDKDETVNMKSKWENVLFVGQDNLEGGKYNVMAQYTAS